MLRPPPLGGFEGGGGHSISILEVEFEQSQLSLIHHARFDARHTFNAYINRQCIRAISVTWSGTESKKSGSLQGVGATAVEPSASISWGIPMPSGRVISIISSMSTVAIHFAECLNRM